MGLIRESEAPVVTAVLGGSALRKVPPDRPAPIDLIVSIIYSVAMTHLVTLARSRDEGMFLKKRGEAYEGICDR